MHIQPLIYSAILHPRGVCELIIKVSPRLIYLGQTRPSVEADSREIEREREREREGGGREGEEFH